MVPSARRPLRVRRWDGYALVSENRQNTSRLLTPGAQYRRRCHLLGPWTARRFRQTPLRTQHAYFGTRSRLEEVKSSGIFLSGGVDSGTIAACAMGLKRDQLLTGSVKGITTVYRRFCDSENEEGPLVNQLSTLQNMPVDYVVGDDVGLIIEEGELGLSDEPSAHIWEGAQRKRLSYAAELGLTVVLTGDGGNEIAAGNLYYLCEHIKKLRLLEAAHELRSICRLEEFQLLATLWTYGIRPIMLAPKWRNFGIPWWAVRERVQSFDLLGEWEADIQPQGDMDTGNWHEAVMINDQSPYLSWEYWSGQRSKMQVFRPFLDQRVVETMLTMPNEIKRFRGLRKHALREAMQGRLPESIRTGKKKLASRARLLESLNVNYGHIEHILTKSIVGGLGFVDEKRMLEALSRCMVGDFSTFGALSNVIRLEIWLRHMESSGG